MFPKTQRRFLTIYGVSFFMMGFFLLELLLASEFSGDWLAFGILHEGILEKGDYFLPVLFSLPGMIAFTFFAVVQHSHPLTVRLKWLRIPLQSILMLFLHYLQVVAYSFMNTSLFPNRNYDDFLIDIVIFSIFLIVDLFFVFLLSKFLLQLYKRRAFQLALLNAFPIFWLFLEFLYVYRFAASNFIDP